MVPCFELNITDDLKIVNVINFSLCSTQQWILNILDEENIIIIIIIIIVIIIIIIIIIIVTIIFGIESTLCGEKNALTSESYPLSKISRTLQRMKAVPSNAAFCKQLMTMGIPMVFRWLSSSSLTVPKAPTTIGITVALTFHNFCTCNVKSWYLVIFSSSFI